MRGGRDSIDHAPGDMVCNANLSGFRPKCTYMAVGLAVIILFYTCTANFTCPFSKPHPREEPWWFPPNERLESPSLLEWMKF